MIAGVCRPVLLGTDASMKPDLICEWLGLPAGTWPPDHYRLLGLEPGESDPERIERSVHERLDTVRRCQMAHPEQATEAMNRLAQAYVCLTDPAGKRAYDAVLFGTAAPAAPAAVADAPAAKGERPDPLAWLFGPADIPRSTDGHAAAPAAPARAAAGQDGNAPASGAGRAGRFGRRVRPAVAEGAAQAWARSGPCTAASSPRADCCRFGSGSAGTSSRPGGG